MTPTAKIIVLISLCVSFAAAQNLSPVDSTLKTIESLYNSGQYISAELEARRLSEEKGITDSVKVHIQKWIAFSLIAQGKTPAAKERFIMLLSLDPNFELDPMLTSPKILSVFNDAKTKFLTQKKSSEDSVRTTIITEELTHPVTFRTMVFPGWEQLHYDRSTHGAIFLGLGTASLGAGVTFEVLRASAKKEYADATRPSDIASKYDTYNRYRKAEIYSFITFAVVYLASEIDVFSHTTRPHLTFLPHSSGEQGVSLALSFPL